MNHIRPLRRCTLPLAILALSRAAVAAPDAPSNCGPSAQPFAEAGCMLDSLVAKKALPGASVLIFQNGREAYFHAVGDADVESGTPVRRNTIFRIYSMTKPITASAIMILVDEGKVRLDDPVSKYVPEMKDVQVYTGIREGKLQTAPVVRAMTIENLLTHTSGLTYAWQPSQPVVGGLYQKVLGPQGEQWRFDPALGGTEGLPKLLARLPLAFQPGTHWHYGMSLDLASVVVERASGQPFDKFLENRIFKPLGMVDTTFWVAPEKAARLASNYSPKPGGGGLIRIEEGARSPLLKPLPGLSGGGGLLSTADDYARFGQMLLNGGEFNGKRILSRRAVALMTTNHLTPDMLKELPVMGSFGLGGSGNGLGFGYGGAVTVEPQKQGVPAFKGEYSWGGAASTTFWIDPVNKLTVVLMTQLLPPSAEMVRDRLHTAVYSHMLRANGSK